MCSYCVMIVPEPRLHPLRPGRIARSRFATERGVQRRAQSRRAVLCEVADSPCGNCCFALNPVRGRLHTQYSVFVLNKSCSLLAVCRRPIGGWVGRSFIQVAYFLATGQWFVPAYKLSSGFLLTRALWRRGGTGRVLRGPAKPASGRFTGLGGDSRALRGQGSRQEIALFSAYSAFADNVFVV